MDKYDIRLFGFRHTSLTIRPYSKGLVGFLLAIILLAVSPNKAEALVDHNILSIDDSTVSVGSMFTTNVLLTNVGEVEGAVVAVQHDPNFLNVISVGIAGVASTADFEAIEMFPTGFTVGFVMDLFSPFGVPPPIPIGNNQVIVEVQYQALAVGMTDLMFVDGVLGNPLKDNIIVIGGLAIGTEEDLILSNGKVTILPVPEPTTLLLLSIGLAGLGFARRRLH